MNDSHTLETDADNDTQLELAAWELLREARRERDEARSEVEKLQDALMQIKNSCVDFADAFDVFVKIHQITVTALNSKIAK